jgi:hypothetical protein
MSAPTRTAPPHYLEIEAALVALDRGVADGLVARTLEGLDHAGARRAAGLLRLGRWREAGDELEAALEAMAGPDSGAGLSWFRAQADAVRDERRRPW